VKYCSGPYLSLILSLRNSSENGSVGTMEDATDLTNMFTAISTMFYSPTEVTLSVQSLTTLSNGLSGLLPQMLQTSTVQFFVTANKIHFQERLFPDVRTFSRTIVADSTGCSLYLSLTPPLNTSGLFYMYYTSDQSTSLTSLCGIRQMNLIGTSPVTLNSKQLATVSIYAAFSNVTKFSFALLYQLPSGQAAIAETLAASSIDWRSCKMPDSSPSPTLTPPPTPTPTPRAACDSCSNQSALISAVISLSVLLAVVMVGWAVTYRVLLKAQQKDAHYNTLNA